MLDLKVVSNEWSLFLDRDGVINHESPGYIFTPAEFVFYDGVLEALSIFNGVFRNIIITTNQRGIGRGMMTTEDLKAIHAKMLEDINAAGGRIDDIYFCPAIDNADPYRKPNPGMAIQAMHDYPSIQPAKAIMVGNNISDMEFGRNAGTHNVLLTTTQTIVSLPHPLVDLQFNSLKEFAAYLKPSVAPL